MSMEGYKLPENDEELKTEVDKVDKRITALWDIARQLRNTEFNDKEKIYSKTIKAWKKILHEMKLAQKKF